MATFRSQRKQIVLTFLALEANQVVSVDRLIDAVWEENPPRTSRSQIHICVSELRKDLKNLGLGDRLQTEAPGYVLRTPPESVDVILFEAICDSAGRSIEEGCLSEAADLLRRAEELWRGRALEGVDNPAVQRLSVRLEDKRLDHLEMSADLELQLGRHTPLIDRLFHRVKEHPFRERSRAQLMLALHRSGRSSEALKVYREGRRELIEQLGIEPKEDLRSLQRLILEDDPSLRLAGAKPLISLRSIPRQLPPDINDFTGRTELIDRITEVFRPETRSPLRRRSTPVVLLSGPGGVGKSALANHVSHLLSSEHFPDGQLYMDLRGSGSTPTTPEDALRDLLRSLGAGQDELSGDLPVLAARYRSRLARRRILVLLEDALDANQVRELLPGSPTCAVIVTSRRGRAWLHSVTRIAVPTMSVEESVEFLGHVIGDSRVLEERPEVEQLARLTGRLPLALRIVGTRLADRLHWSVATMVERLGDAQRRLDELSHENVTVRSVIAFAYDSQSEGPQRLLRLLCSLDIEHFPAWVAQALLDVDPDTATDLLDHLVDAQLCEADPSGTEGGRPRYTVHDLVRVFVREKLHEEPIPDRSRALARVADGWLTLVEAAYEQVYKRKYTTVHGEPSGWRPEVGLSKDADHFARLNVECGNVCRTIEQLASADLHEKSWNLAVRMLFFFEMSNRYTEWESTHLASLAATRRAGNEKGTAALLGSLGSLALSRMRLIEARRLSSTSVEEFERLGVDGGRGLALRDLAMVDHLEGEHEDAGERLRAASEAFKASGDLVEEAYVRILTAHLDLETGVTDSTFHGLWEALDLCRSTGSERLEAQALRILGGALLQRDQPREALRVLIFALDLVEASGDRLLRALLLRDRAKCHMHLHGLSDSEFYLRHAAEVAREIDLPWLKVEVEADLGEVLLEMGRPTEAAERLDEARETAERYGLTRPASRLERLGELCHPEKRNSPRPEDASPFVDKVIVRRDVSDRSDIGDRTAGHLPRFRALL